MKLDQKIRGILFYFSLILFFVGLPLILSSALGYKFNPRNFKLIKTGLIFIKTYPEGAKIYLNDKLINQTSPASIPDLNPGVYKVSLEIEQHYPWKSEIDVEGGKVTRLDKIILFPFTPELEQLSRAKFSGFHVDSERKLVYYLDQANKVIYRSNLEGSIFEDVASIPAGLSAFIGWEVSPDAKKMFLFGNHQISIIFFDNQSDYVSSEPVYLDSKEKILHVFWHSDNYHLVVLTEQHIQVIEARASAKPVDLVELTGQKIIAFYDIKQDNLYFSDNQNLYKLGLNTNLFSFEKLMSEPFKAIKPLQSDSDE